MKGAERNRVMDCYSLYRNCRLCPRACGVDRTAGGGSSKNGFCNQTDQLRISYVGPHFGEEPPISGEKGSGTIFFSGCSLQCSFCQNYQISRDGIGRNITVLDLLKEVRRLCSEHRVHNINMVTPDHFFPHIFDLVSRMQEEAMDVPVLYNLSGYQSLDLLKMLAPFADIYLPDFKYADARLGQRFSKVNDYPEKALDAIVEMVRQKGFLRSAKGRNDPAGSGVLVRHLILPGNVENSLNALTTLFLEFGRDLPVSIMSQYYPVQGSKDPDLNRRLFKEEFDRVYAHAVQLGFRQLYVQFPQKARQEKAKNEAPPFLPDFRKATPFKQGRE